MDTARYDFDIPDTLIARRPALERTDSRLLHLHTQGIDHHQFFELPQLLNPGDLLVLNNTRVMPARLFGHKATGGKVEVLIERLIGEREAWVQARSTRTLKPDTELCFRTTRAWIGDERDGRLYLLRSEQPLREVMAAEGAIPLPPYIRRATDAQDSERYQTVYAKTEHEQSVAAPTAGLHFSDSLLQHLRQECGVLIAELTLHVGAGTFLPVTSQHPRDHKMHSEYVEVDSDLCQSVARVRDQGGRIVAVGTTCVRALESCALANGGVLKPWKGDTNLFIYPDSGFRFTVVDSLISNFHLPRSSLLMLVSAFAGYQPVMDAYAAATAAEYRFYSYGDAMLMHRNPDANSC